MFICPIAEVYEIFLLILFYIFVIRANLHQ